MHFRKPLLILAAVALPLSSVALLGGTAWAKSTTESGTLNCAVLGTANFNPALTPTGEAVPPGPKKEIVTIDLSLASCTGSGVSPASPGAPSSGTVSAKAVKVKASGSPKSVASCSEFASASSTISVKTKETWSNGIKGSKATLGNLTVIGNSDGEIGFNATGGVSGSFAGSASVNAYFTKASSTAIENCETGASSTPVSSLTFDGSTSTSSF